MENRNLNLLIVAFLALILGVALIGQVASNSSVVTDKKNVADESHSLASCVLDIGGDLDFTINESNSACNITVTNYPTNWKQEDCPLTSVVVGNATLDFTEDTDYRVFASSGVIQLLNTTTTSTGYANTTLVDYTYCGDDYLNSAWGRSVMKMVGGFFALALLGIGIWLMYGIFRNEGIIGK